MTTPPDTDPQVSQAEMMADLAALLQKHGLKSGVLLVPVGNYGTSCLRFGVCPHIAGRILLAVGEDLASGKHPENDLRTN